MKQIYFSYLIALYNFEIYKIFPYPIPANRFSRSREAAEPRPGLYDINSSFAVFEDRARRVNAPRWFVGSLFENYCGNTQGAVWGGLGDEIRWCERR